MDNINLESQMSRKRCHIMTISDLTNAALDCRMVAIKLSR
jgi:hypothetical protein